MPFDDTATDTSATSEGEGPNPTGPNPTGPNPTGPNPTSPTTATEPPQCYGDGDCPPGYFCQNGFCYYDGYCDDGYCCYDTCCGFECGWYYECFSNVECPAGYSCQYNECQPIAQEYECGIITLDFQIPISAGGNVASLAFMNGNGDGLRDLVVGQVGEVDYVDGATLGVSQIAVGPNARDVATGDLDGDGDDDILVADGAVGGGMRVLLNDGAWTPLQIFESEQNLRGVALGDVEADGFPDLWGYSDSNGTFLAPNYGAGMFASVEQVFDPATSLATGDLDGDAYSDTAIYAWSTYVLLEGPGFNLYGLWDQTSRDQRVVAVGDYNGSPPDDVVVLQAVNGVTVSSSWASPVIESAPYHSWWAVPVSQAETADMNGDGYADIVAAAAGYPLVVAFGAPEQPPDVVNCVQYIEVPISAGAIAVGDLTGDGRPDVAVSDGVAVVVLAQSG